jgi:PhnB protein
MTATHRASSAERVVLPGMTIQTATPYLFLNGRAAQAVSLYERALGATVEVLQRFGDVDPTTPDTRRELVMHCLLHIGNARLMLSDGDGPGPLAETSNVNVAVEFDDADEMQRSFDALGATGSVVQAIFPAPWGALFGIVRDEFRITWMFNCVK